MGFGSDCLNPFIYWVFDLCKFYYILVSCFTYWFNGDDSGSPLQVLVRFKCCELIYVKYWEPELAHVWAQYCDSYRTYTEDIIKIWIKHQSLVIFC